MDSNLNSTINLFPNPPKYYKNFINENSMSPPDLNIINKVNSFMSFGVEYKLKEINSTHNPVDTQFLNIYDLNIIQSKNIPNQNIFQDQNVILSNLTIDNLNLNIFDAISNEVLFLNKTYKEMLTQITLHQDFELNSCLIKFSFQKIYFLISLMKKKKILIEFISYFRKEIDKNTNLENIFSNNLENCKNVLQDGLRKIKEDREKDADNILNN